MKPKILFFLIAFFSTSLFAMNVNNGVARFDILSEDEKIIRLDGEWEFFKGQTFNTLGVAKLKSDFVQVPSAWNENVFEDNSSVDSYGSNTYRILVTGLHANSEYGIFSRSSPALAARVFANGKFIAEYGSFARRKDNYKPAQVPMICTLTSNERGVIELVIQVSNFTQNHGGLLEPIMFGHYNDIRNLYILTLTIIAAIAGSIVFILLTNFLIWFFDRNYMQSLYFSIFLLTLLFRILCGDFNAASIYVPSFSFALQAKLRNLAFLSFGIFPLVYRRDRYITVKHPNLDKNISFFALGLTIVFICLPIEFVSYAVVFFLAVSFVFLGYSLVRMIFSFKTHQFYVGIYTCFYSIVFTGIILDYFIDGPTEMMWITFSEIGIIILIFIVVVYLAIFLEKLVRVYSRQKNELSKNYIAYRKFVPSELPHLVKKENFGKIEQGDNSEFEATIMVLGMVVISPDKTQISLREQFETIGFYSSKVVDIVEQAGGMVLSFSDNSLTALFRKSSSEALNVAYEIQNVLNIMNVRRAQDYYPCVSFNVALHYGSVVLGIIGCESRIDCTLVSQNIELTNNICTLAYYKEIPVIVSELVVKNLTQEDKAKIYDLGRIKFSENPIPIKLYGLIAADNPDKRYSLTQRDADKYVNL